MTEKEAKAIQEMFDTIFESFNVLGNAINNLFVEKGIFTRGEFSGAIVKAKSDLQKEKDKNNWERKTVDDFRNLMKAVLKAKQDKN